MSSVKRNGSGWREASCRYLQEGKQCPQSGTGGSWFCDRHRAQMEALSNQDLLKMQADSVANGVYVSDLQQPSGASNGKSQRKENGRIGNKRSKDKPQKSLTMKQEVGTWDGFYNSWHALVARGYDDQDILECTGLILKRRNVFSGWLNQLRGAQEWREFEKLVAGIHIPLHKDIRVTFNDTLTDKHTGKGRQIDVSLRSKLGFYDHLTVIECRDKTRPLIVDEVEAFRTKREDVGAQKGIMVSPVGFTDGARQKARSYDIDLFTLKPQISEWTQRETRRDEVVPVPQGFRFDCSPMEDDFSVDVSSFDDCTIYQQNQQPKTITEVASLACQAAMRQKLKLPGEVRMNFRGKEPYFLRVSGQTADILLTAVIVELEPQVRHGHAHTLDIPPQITAYVYTNVFNGENHLIAPEELPIGVDTVLKPGHYYTDRFKLKWRCIAIEGEEAVMWLMEFAAGGIEFDVEGRKSLSEAHQFVPLDDPAEETRLEERYQQHLKQRAYETSARES